MEVKTEERLNQTMERLILQLEEFTKVFGGAVLRSDQKKEMDEIRAEMKAQYRKESDACQSDDGLGSRSRIRGQ